MLSMSYPQDFESFTHSDEDRPRIEKEILGNDKHKDILPAVQALRNEVHAAKVVSSEALCALKADVDAAIGVTALVLHS